ncbi:MAG TPA: prepilin-type N-terminal cleavage/methylation domain-containing protein [Thermoleophilaceae bacterium]|jgi:prepilin-type N-terminal cleavage/methylation domain-containing protein
MRTRLASEDSGFTLVELLVVVLVIGVLAAIALAMFSTQKQKGQDADAKSNASALVSAVDRCYVDTGDFTACDGTGPNDELGKTNLPIGAGREQVSVTAATFNTFTVTATSAADDHFIVSQGPTSTQTHTCDAGAAGNSGGGCTDGSW